jgi:hypothetical protein
MMWTYVMEEAALQEGYMAMQDKIMRELEAEGANGFPFVRIGDRVVEGYQPDRYAKLLEL